MPVIVVIGDNAPQRDLLVRHARAIEPDITVSAFEAPEPAFDWIANHAVDLVVVEAGVGGRPTAEVVRLCRARLGNPITPILLVSDFEDREVRRLGLEAGASDVFQAPVDPQEFRARAGNLLALGRLSAAVPAWNERAGPADDGIAAATVAERMLRGVMDTVPALICAADAAGRIVFLNHHHRVLLGIDPVAAVGRGWRDVFGPLRAERHRALDRRVFQTGEETGGVEENISTQDGERLFLTRKMPLRDETGGISLVVTVSLDITARARAEETVRKLSLAVEQSPASVIITDAEGVIEYVNPKFVAATGYAPEDVVGKTPRILQSGQTPGEQYRDLWRTITAGQEWRGEFNNRKKSGELFWEYTAVSPIKDSDGAITHFLAVKEDVTLRRRYEEQLLRQANYDDVIGLPNRVLAFDRLSQALARAHRNQSLVGLLCVDLDRFKIINDTLGRAVGDRVLQQVGRRCAATVREGDTVARLGGDEFAIVLPDLCIPTNGERVAEKILKAIARPFRVDDRELFLTASIGITVYPLDANDPHALMRNADAAMYRAKETGRNCAQYFTPELNTEVMKRARVETALRHAQERREFSVHYQPIMDVRSRRLVAAEALLRWKSADLGQVPPDDFIPLAEDTGLISPIGEWVLNDVCRQLQAWRADGMPPIRVSVNVSSRQFRGTSLVAAVRRALEEAQVPSELLELEITEGLLMDDMDATMAAVHELNAMGVRFLVDDFGTGYSSLSYLRRFPVNKLKIDRTFTHQMMRCSDHAALVQAIIHMAHSLNMGVVAEGIETAQEYSFLRGQGCDMAQGFLVAKPMPAADFEAFVKGWGGISWASGVEDGEGSDGVAVAGGTSPSFSN